MHKLLSICLLLALVACKKDEVTGQWSIPNDEVVDGGPGKDGIPSVDNPRFITAVQATYLQDEDLVLGMVMGNEIKAWPHPILDWHEIVNDEIDGQAVAITYCPLTGTGTAWNRNLNGNLTTFGVSGLLFNSNLIPYDRGSGSNWSQMQLKCVNGSLEGTEVDLFPILETTWATWKKMYPQTTVMSTETGHDRRYGDYPYNDYRTNHEYLLFPVDPTDERLPAKERVLGIMSPGNDKAYPFSAFAGEAVVLIQEQVGNQPLVIAGSQRDNYIVAFNRFHAGSTQMFDFAAIQDSLPYIMRSADGTVWDVFGKGHGGASDGLMLQATRSYIGYFFAWGAFFPGIELYQ